jgi:hypothetical protein
VQTGEQPTADPDVHELVGVTADGVRHYRDGLCKRLVEGRWVETRDEETPGLRSQ